MNHILFLTKWKSVSLALMVVVMVSFLCSLEVSAQVNRKKKNNNFSSIGMRSSTIRHGVTLHVGGGLGANTKQPMMIVPAAGVGYVASQYYGVGNRFMQQSITYQLGYGVTPETFLVHNLVGTFHCTYIGKADLNPFIYGIALQFAYAGKSNKTFTRAYSNFYVRPEIGIALPVNYKSRTKEVSLVTAMITYGFNIRTYWKFKPENEGYASTLPNAVQYPWTAMCHHVITVRINFNLLNMREVRK
ncbi:MAG: hypothetical protein LBR36_07935 [Bacteroidales bacterium]|jgi:hypothetical protein|nr:hypothetical protein [Bacteroidales bacterium]